MKSVILIDKPAGPTSYEVVDKACRILGVEKAGHAGTLDPNVTGLLLIALDEARKCMPLLSGLDKEYEGQMLFHADIEEERIRELAREFTGKIRQIPPVRSAVSRKERERIVYEFEIISVESRITSFRILCEAGTYIRKICHDMGEAEGSGAHMAILRRTKVGPFSLNEAISLEMLEKEPEKHLIQLEDALKRIGIREIAIKPEFAQKARNGSPIERRFAESLPEGIKKGENIWISSEGKIIGIGKTIRNCPENLSSKVRIAKLERVVY